MSIAPTEPTNVRNAMVLDQERKRRRKADPMLVPEPEPPAPPRDPTVVAAELQLADRWTLLASQDISTWRLCERAQKFVTAHHELILSKRLESLPMSGKLRWDSVRGRAVHPVSVARTVQLVALIGNMFGYGHPHHRPEVIELLVLFRAYPESFPPDIEQGYWTQVFEPAVVAAVAGESPPRPRITQERDLAV
jgi:hypothetical protein